MCEFCKNIQIGFPNWNFDYDEETDTVPNGDMISLLKIHGHIAIAFTNSASEYETGHIKINFCPMCGIDLRLDDIVVGNTETLEKFGIDLRSGENE